ncbi:uncharacterized protein LOC107269336 isoform X2 [Cephus cinctus]|nr:uncharacterized protein LOC107269336 isoform X2 [Cephus cinctus]
MGAPGTQEALIPDGRPSAGIFITCAAKEVSRFRTRKSEGARREQSGKRMSDPPDEKQEGRVAATIKPRDITCHVSSAEFPTRYQSGCLTQQKGTNGRVQGTNVAKKNFLLSFPSGNITVRSVSDSKMELLISESVRY